MLKAHSLYKGEVLRAIQLPGKCNGRRFGNIKAREQHNEGVVMSGV